MAQQREQRSLFGEILDWMLAPLLLLWPMSVALTWLVAQGIANRPYDRDLGERAQALAQQFSAQVSAPDRVGAAVRAELRRSAAMMVRSEDEDTMFYQVLGERGELVAGDARLTVPPDGALSAPNEVRFRDDVVGDDAVRVAYVWLPLTGVESEHGPLVQIAETLDKRSRLATEIIKGVILPQFVILPLAVMLVWFALARGIRPLSELQQRIRRRESTDLSPIDQRDVPEEVAPLVAAINDLLQRLESSMGTQRHFLADAAHQLKTPLAGLRMQAELAAREIDGGRDDPASVKRSLEQIALSSERAAHMVNQLLAMARAEDREQALRKQSIDLAEITRETVRDFVPKAMDKRIDLGYEGPEAGVRARDGAQPRRQRVAVHARRWHRDHPRADRPLRPGGGAAGGGQRPGHPGGRARAGVPALLPGTGHECRRQRPGAGDRAGGGRAARGHGLDRGRPPAAARTGSGGAVHGAFPARRRGALKSGEARAQSLRVLPPWPKGAPRRPVSRRKPQP